MTLFKKLRNSGFTFVELLVVITIIGVIFASGIVSFTAITTRSRDARRKSDLESIRQSLEMCRSVVGTYPTSIYDANSALSCAVSGPILMTKTPTDPRPCGSPVASRYTYNRTSTVTYVLTAPCMENDATYQVINP